MVAALSRRRVSGDRYPSRSPIYYVMYSGQSDIPAGYLHTKRIFFWGSIPAGLQQKIFNFVVKRRKST